MRAVLLHHTTSRLPLVRRSVGSPSRRSHTSLLGSSFSLLLVFDPHLVDVPRQMSVEREHALDRFLKAVLQVLVDRRQLAAVLVWLERHSDDQFVVHRP